MKIIHGIDTETGATGHGEPVPDYLADVWVEEGNKEYPLIKHRSERVEVNESEQLIDDERDREERREYENEIMVGDEKSEE